MLKGHLPRVIYHQVYEYTKMNSRHLTWQVTSVTRVPVELRHARMLLAHLPGTPLTLIPPSIQRVCTRVF